MEPLVVVVTVLVVVVLALLLFQISRGQRQERALRDELGKVSLALAESQRATAAQMGGQLTDVLDRVHRALGDYGQQAASRQSGSDDKLRGGLEEVGRTLGGQLGVPCSRRRVSRVTRVWGCKPKESLAKRRWGSILTARRVF